MYQPRSLFVCGGLLALLAAACSDDAPALPDDRQFTPSICCECSCSDGTDVCNVAEIESDDPDATCESLCAPVCAADDGCAEVASIGICPDRRPPPSGSSDLVCSRVCAAIDQCQVSIEHLAPNGCLEQCRTERVPIMALACVDASDCEPEALYGCFSWEARLTR
jgi:hypothetical protein